MILLLMSCSGTDTGNPIVDGGTIDETETQVSGVVQDSLHNPVPNCSLWVRPQHGSDTGAIMHRGTTDSHGAFLFKRFKKGDYSMVAMNPADPHGRMFHFHIELRDTLDFTDSLILEPLQRLVLPLDSSWIGRSIEITELGLSIQVTTDTIIIPNVPVGIYNIASDTLVIQYPSQIPASSLQDTTTIDTTTKDTTIQDSSTTNSVFVWDTTSSTGTLTDLRDSSMYKIINLGSTYWFTSNLHVASTYGLCNSNDPYASTNCQIYGRYYPWSEAQTVCPDGWHLPTLLEWQGLFFLVGGEAIAGAMLKSDSGWATTQGVDNYGFTAYPAGDAVSPSLGTSAFFWTSDSIAATSGQAVFILDSDAAAHYGTVDFTTGRNVRCVKSSL